MNDEIIRSPEWLSREATLIGDDAVEKLKKARILLFGCGGVGSYTAEALIRSGVGYISVVDFDTVSKSNINRQIIATHKTVGMSKVLLMRERALDINPDISFNALSLFVNAENASEIIESEHPDYVIDAIDNVSAKIAIAEYCYKNGIPIIASMGTGNKLDQSRFRITDIKKTEVCPLAKVMRRELRLRGISNIEVLWSDEQPLKNGERTPASISFVPSAAGLMIAGHVIKRICNLP
ncbi:MAG: tRNA threonylcarbamoyladenosine dehydratase [Clostridia bacterium]|nr:tRNA threonylcarbamoyladenosine dehydratase [Clostridia bacterium]